MIQEWNYDPSSLCIPTPHGKLFFPSEPPQSPFCLLRVNKCTAQLLLSANLLGGEDHAPSTPGPSGPGPSFSTLCPHHGTAQCRVEASVDTGVGAQGEELSSDFYGRCGPGGVSFSCHLPPSLPSLRLGQAESHQPAPPLPKAARCFISGARAEGDRTSPRSVDNKVIIQGDETELSGVS